MIAAIHGILEQVRPGNKELLTTGKDASNNSIQTATIPFSVWSNFPANSPFTIEHWVKPSNVTGQHDIFNALPQGTGFRTLISDGVFYTQVFNGSTSALANGGPALLNTYQFSAGTFNGSNIKSYRGVDADSFALINTSGTISWTYTNPLNIGMFLGSQANKAFSYAGSYDLIRLWNIARTEADLKANMYAVLPNNTPGLIAQWVVDKSTGTVLSDTKGAYNLTLSVAGSIISSTDSPLIY